MSEPFLGEVKIISWNFPPKGWAFCNGQLLPINQNQALFSILGTTYGGDGRTTFALPNLQGRMPVHVGNGIVLGERAVKPRIRSIFLNCRAHNHAPWAAIPIRQRRPRPRETCGRQTMPSHLRPAPPEP